MWDFVWLWFSQQSTIQECPKLANLPHRNEAKLGSSCPRQVYAEFGLRSCEFWPYISKDLPLNHDNLSTGKTGCTFGGQDIYSLCYNVQILRALRETVCVFTEAGSCASYFCLYLLLSCIIHTLAWLMGHLIHAFLFHQSVVSIISPRILRGRKYEQGTPYIFSVTICVCLWDARCSQQFPIQKHPSPIYLIQLRLG